MIDPAKVPKDSRHKSIDEFSAGYAIYQWEISRIQQMEVRKRTICLAIFSGDIP